jgi:hypothetical protein
MTDNADPEDFPHFAWDTAIPRGFYLRTVSGAPEIWTMDLTLAQQKAFSTAAAPSAPCVIGAGTRAGRVAYVENVALMAGAVGATSAFVASLPSPAHPVRGVECSPTTPHVTVHSAAGGTIYLVNTDSGSVEALVADAIAETGAAWSRDGAALVLARAANASTGVLAGLWTFTGAGTTSAAYAGRIASAPATAQWPAWCGNSIVYESAGNLYLIVNR